jgi:hypothetical protein
MTIGKINHPILEVPSFYYYYYYYCVVCMSCSGEQPWILKRCGLESFGQRLVSLNGKIKRIAFHWLFNFLSKSCQIFWKKGIFWTFMIFWDFYVFWQSWYVLDLFKIVLFMLEVLRSLDFVFLPDPRGAGLAQAFQISSVRPYVRPSVRPTPFGLIWSYTANIPRTPNNFTDSGPPIKWLLDGAD